jgi:hypothetical protein
MTSFSPDSEIRTSADSYTRLLTQVASGILDGLQCPECDLHSVSVCLTPHHAGEYRSWFICASCDFRLRAQNRPRPSRPAVPGWLEKKNDHMRRYAIFKPPVGPIAD